MMLAATHAHNWLNLTSVHAPDSTLVCQSCPATTTVAQVAPNATGVRVQRHEVRPGMRVRPCTDRTQPFRTIETRTMSFPHITLTFSDAPGIASTYHDGTWFDVA